MFSIKTFFLPFFYGAISCALISNSMAAGQIEPADPLANDIMDLSLEELLNIEVTSVSKKRQKLSETAAAVFVITQDDIRRSGVTSIPEALRMAPGVQVARIDSNKWAVGIRGDNRRFADKLLVLIDGRSVYTPSFSGVQWDIQDTLLDDVDRIEVIRGPGASLWGANAVNGVINIITKSAEDTQGGLVNAGIGTEERGFGALRYGGTFGPDVNYRVYAKYFDRDGGKSLSTGEDTADDWQVSRAGFRTDWQSGADDSITMQGDIYTGDIGETSRQFSFSPPSLTLADREQDVSGGNLLWRWNHSFSDESSLSLQTYYDRTSREWELLGKETRDTIDIDFQHRFQLGSRNDLVWGLGYRFTDDNFTIRDDTLQFDPDSRDFHLFSAFFHDEISLIPDRVSLILGSKFEHNDFTGFEYQPNARLHWIPTEKQTAWLSVSRAVRVPSRHDHDGTINGLFGVFNFPSPLAPGVVSVNGTRDLDAERLFAYELGYRNQVTHNFSLDISGFYNDYKNLRGGVTRTPICEPFGTPIADPSQCLTIFGATHTLLPIAYNDQTTAEAYGAEIALDWRVTDYWRLHGAYSYLQLQYHSVGEKRGEDREGESPHHQASLRSAFDIRDNLELDLWLRYTEDLPALEVRNYLTLDARLAWRPFEQLELSIVGQNLLDGRHQEFRSEIGDIPPVEIQRSGYFQMKVNF